MTMATMTKIIKFKKLNENAVVPTRAHVTDAGYDIVATSKSEDEYGNVVYGTGLALEIPKGYVGLLFPRSSNSKKDLILSNSVGILDSGYRGEVMFKFKCAVKSLSLGSLIRLAFGSKKSLRINNFTKNSYEVGDRIGQLIIMPLPKVEFLEAESLEESDRGEGGYGSTGR